MTDMTYDTASPDSILDHAFKLTGNTLRDFLSPEEQLLVVNDKKNKGLLGNLVEKYYFHINPGTSPLPDFPDAGIELKTAAVIPSSSRPRRGPLPITPSAYQAKERLKLTSINYTKLVNETWADNSLFKKCACILLMLSLYEADKELLDRRFIAEPIMWKLSGKDMEFIMNDWMTIVTKVKDGKADELSGADTFYLEACTSGSGKMVEQPNSSVKAKERSFAFKASFVDASFLREPRYVESLPSILKKGDDVSDFEEIILGKIRKYEGMAIKKIAANLDYELSRAKQYLALLSYRMLGIRSDKVEEFVKAGIQVKTINLNPNGTPGEDMSFPAFSYMDIVDEDWEESTFKQKIDTKTLFMVFNTDKDGAVHFLKGCFWSMPKEDIEDARRVWEETKARVIGGRADVLPNKSFSKVAHVRNHGTDSKAENHKPSPKNGMLAVKGFWLNAGYIRKQVENLLDRHI